MNWRLSDLNITVSRRDNVVAIKRILTQIILYPIKKLKLRRHGRYMDDNDFFDDIDLNDVFIELVSDEEANKFVIIKVNSFDPMVPEYIQVKKTDILSQVLDMLHSRTRNRAFGLLTDDGNCVPDDLSIERCGLVDDAEIYMDYGDIKVSVVSPTSEEESITVKITPESTGLNLKMEVSSRLNKPADKLILVVTNADNTKFKMIEDSQYLFKYGLTQNSIIKWIEVQNLDGIEIFRENLNTSGGTTKVFKARVQHDGQMIAVKEYNADTTASDFISKSKSFGNDLIVLWRLSIYGQFDRIVKFISINGNRSNFYFAMELMEKSLMDIVKTEGHLTDTDVRKYTRQIIEGLMFLHNLKILHRNLKCSSVLLDCRNNVKLCSFGLSKYMIGCTNDDITNGQQGSRPIDCHWIAPETLEYSKWSVYTDIWSLGATVIEMRTGNKPYHNDNPCHAMQQIIRDKRLAYDRPVDMNDETYAIFDDFISCCSRDRPAERSRLNDLLEHKYLNP